MSSHSFAAIIILIFTATDANSPASAQPATSRPTTRLAQLTNEQLIDHLMLTTNDQYSVRTNIIAAGGPLAPGLLMQQAPELNAIDAREELLRRGAAALPDLLKHLDDARKTKAKISPMSGGITYTTKLDRNTRTSRINPGKMRVNSRRAHDRGVKDSGDFARAFGGFGSATGSGDYEVAVGDLCFEAVGQIVNRSYSASGYQPSGIILVNSPVMSDDLCKAVRDEWRGFAAAEHCESLAADVETPDYPHRASEAIKSLLRYYPASAPAAVRKRLSMPVYNSTEIGDFFEKQLKPADPPTRKHLADEAIAAKGPSFRDGLLWYLFYHQETPPARDILLQLFGDYTEENPPAINSVDLWDLGDFMVATEETDSVEIAQTIWQKFLQYSREHGETWTAADYVAASAARALAHKGHDAELIAFCNRRLSEIRPAKEHEYDTRILHLLLPRLTSSLPPPPVNPYTGW